MANVYFKRYEGTSFDEVSEIAKELLACIVKKEKVSLNDYIPIKVHFGEGGNKTFIKPIAYDGIIDYLEENNKKACYIETNVLYKGSRTIKSDHLLTAKEHGFNRLPIIIADGNKGELVSKVKIDKNYFTSVQIGKEFDNFNQYIVCSHFKGHGAAGFGGAIKQLAMGFSSRGGKMAQHSDIKPVIDEDRCVKCKICAVNCDVNAIEMKNYPVINDSCIGCAGCIAVCPMGAMDSDWNGSDFIEKLTEYAYGAQLNKNNIYINFMMNITKYCDCVPKEMPLIAKNYGVLISTDPVSIDKACLDMIQQDYKDIFSKGEKTFPYSKEIDFGELEYNLIEM